MQIHPLSVLYSASQLHRHLHTPPATSASGSPFPCSCGTSQSNRTLLQKLRLVCLFGAHMMCIIVSVAGKSGQQGESYRHTHPSHSLKRVSGDITRINMQSCSGGCLLFDRQMPSPQTATFPAILLSRRATQKKRDLGCKRQRQGCPGYACDAYSLNALLAT